MKYGKIHFWWFHYMLRCDMFSRSKNIVNWRRKIHVNRVWVSRTNPCAIWFESFDVAVSFEFCKCCIFYFNLNSSFSFFLPSNFYKEIFDSTAKYERYSMNIEWKLTIPWHQTFCSRIEDKINAYAVMKWCNRMYKEYCFKAKKLLYFKRTKNSTQSWWFDSK